MAPTLIISKGNMMKSSPIVQIPGTTFSDLIALVLSDLLEKFLTLGINCSISSRELLEPIPFPTPCFSSTQSSFCVPKSAARARGGVERTLVRWKTSTVNASSAGLSLLTMALPDSINLCEGENSSKIKYYVNGGATNSTLDTPKSPAETDREQLPAGAKLHAPSQYP